MFWTGQIVAIVGLLAAFIAARECVRTRFKRAILLEVLALIMALVGQGVAVVQYWGDDRAANAQKLRIKQLEGIVAKHEFIPLSEALRTRMVTQLRSIAPDLKKAGIHVVITHETWAPPPVRQFADQLAVIYREAGLDVEGPEDATVYLAQKSRAVEWGFYPDEAVLLDPLIAETMRVLPKNDRHGKRRFSAAGKVRIHFAGKPTFAPNGVLTME